MGSEVTGLLEMLLVFGSLMVFLIWELVSLRRDQNKNCEKSEKSEKSEQSNRKRG